MVTSNSFLSKEWGLPHTRSPTSSSNSDISIQKIYEALYTDDEESHQALDRLLTFSSEIEFFFFSCLGTTHSC